MADSRGDLINEFMEDQLGDDYVFESKMVNPMADQINDEHIMELKDTASSLIDNHKLGEFSPFFHLYVHTIFIVMAFHRGVEE